MTDQDNPQAVTTTEPPRPPALPSSPASMLQAAIERGIDADGIVKLAEVFERMEQIRAEREFTAALVQFQHDAPPILKTKPGIVRDGRAILYAPIDKIKEEIDPVLWRNGLTLTWDTILDDQKGAVTAIVTLRHIGGYKASSTVKMPISPAPKMNDTQGAASAITYALRYAVQAVMGIVPRDQDDDGQAAGRSPLPPEQLKQLKDLLDLTNAWEDKTFWQYAKVGKLEDVTAADFARLFAALMRLKANQEAAKKGGNNQ